jgi:hypothetical protein
MKNLQKHPTAAHIDILLLSNVAMTLSKLALFVNK